MTDAKAKPIVIRPPPRPWDETRPARHQLLALQAVAYGTATAEQQRLAVAFIIRGVAGADLPSFWPGAGGEHGYDGRRASDYAEGRRSVGIELRRLITLTALPGASRRPMPAVDLDHDPSSLPGGLPHAPNDQVTDAD